MYCRPNCPSMRAKRENVVFVSCHRALRADDGLAGYRWDVERKQAMLVREDSI
ncbi:MAG: Ada metal-binding domain-containing protein [Dehalococcoidia bacterium]|nr:Ada metal-binding domain-containing protein [Dehalococcoidia bacterium]